MKIAVIGDGGWGTATALLLNGYGHDVTVWGPFPDYVEEIKSTHLNPRYLKGVAIPETISWTADRGEAVKGAEIVVLALTSKYYGAVCETFKGIIPVDALVVSLTKGLCEKTHARMSELATSILGVKRVVVLSGPTHAEEVSRGVPTTIVAASADPADAEIVQRVWSGPKFRVYTSSDPVGVEIGGAVKNVIAIAVGASDGLGFGDNTRAALITRGLAEVGRFAAALGAQPATVYGLSGVGDLIVTCTSVHSRNHFVGERLGKGEKMADVLGSMQMVAEGVWNAKVIHGVARSLGVEMPITELVYKLCYEDYPARDAIAALMSRDLKSE
ncbi:MAG: NAD(P)-dependent glycerol-3-phosphate dehydrogenase [Kiritimatiellae bacterium]|nr:NAD(P)-dependent glycerol-3-phosphate dehydrogenase [Kiritimatiellia bacterium]